MSMKDAHKLVFFRIRVGNGEKAGSGDETGNLVFMDLCGGGRTEEGETDTSIISKKDQPLILHVVMTAFPSGALLDRLEAPGAADKDSGAPSKFLEPVK